MSHKHATDGVWPGLQLHSELKDGWIVVYIDTHDLPEPYHHATGPPKLKIVINSDIEHADHLDQKGHWICNRS